MGDLISKEAVMDVINRHKCDTSEIILGVLDLPTVEAEPVVHGEWVFDSFTAKYGKPYHCSRCHEERGDTYNYCPECGAKMNGGVSDD